MRLIKLIAYSLFGYALYEFVRGIVQDEAVQAALPAVAEKKPRSRGRRSAAITDVSGGGQRVATLERDGGGTQHRVGRGVVH